MRLIKTRPEVRLYLPAKAIPGERVLARVLLDARRPVPVEHVRCKLEGTEVAAVGSGNQRRQQQRVLIRLAADLLGEGELAEGRSEFRCTFDLPADLPASYEGRFAHIRYIVTVEVGIPWWPDRSGSFILSLASRPHEVTDSGPSLHATNPAGPRAHEPHLELSLATRVVQPGATIHGQLALENVAFNRYETATIALVGYETVFGRRLEALRYAIRLPVLGYGNAEPIPFAMKLPGELLPTTSASLFTLDWQLAVNVDHGWRRSFGAAVDVTVLPEGSTKRDLERRAPLVIGSGRVRAIWERVAAQAGLTFDAEAHRMSGRHGEISLSLRRDHRGEAGIFLAAEIRYPSLGLDLDGGEAKSLRRIIGGGVPLGDQDWDRRHYLTGRDPTQIASFVQPLGPFLRALSLVDVSDEEMVVALRDSGQAEATLARFVSAVTTLVAQLPAARGAIVAPRAMASAEPSWLGLARRLGGQLDRATMTVAGRFDDAAVRVATAWSPRGEALHTEIELEPPFAVDPRYELSWRSGALEQGDISLLPERAQVLFTGLTKEALSLAVAPPSIASWLPAPVLEAEALVARIEKLLSFASALHGERGPYR